MRTPLAMLLPVLLCLAAPASAEDAEVVVLDEAVIQWIEPPEPEEPGDFVIGDPSHFVQRTVELPSPPAAQRDARRILATVTVEPIFSETEGRRRPNDPWTRLGFVTVVPPGEGPAEETQVELLRFTTGYGAAATYEQDVTAFAPLLHGRRTLRAAITTYSREPGWRITLKLRYTDEGVGQRRPVYARQVFGNAKVTAMRSKLTTAITIRPDLDLPRLRIISTGHATDGSAENEFVSCTHVLRVDGTEIARWRPWSERGGPLRDRNPWAGRRTIDGREVRASDFDRSGWNPGLVVEPLIIPVPELTPGRHVVEIEILGIRPMDPPTPEGKQHFGYWMLSATVVADEPWPEEGD